MSYDGMVTHCVVDELNKLLVGGKIDKIHQPERDEIILGIRTLSGSYRLLLSASASNPRVHLTDITKENPMTPPLLCMLMRKHLTGNKIIGIYQQGFDRVIKIELEGRNELGDICNRYIICEIMGRHSNIIIVDSNGKILDSAKHIDFTVSAVRQILPGLIYEAPPSQNKLLPNDFCMVDLLRELENAPADTLLDKFLLSSFIGMSPLLAREIVYRFTNNTKAFRTEINCANFVTFVEDFLKDICNNIYCPTLVISNTDKNPSAFSCVALTQYEDFDELKTYSSISQVIDGYYEKRAQREHMNQRANYLLKLVNNNIDRCEKKLSMHMENLEKSKDRDKYKIYGDLITANLYKMAGGEKELTTENYYTDDLSPITIPLKDDLSPSQNAQRYYKLYNKAKTTEKYASEQIIDAEKEKYYLESVKVSLENVETPTDLAEIKDELADCGYIPKIKSKIKKQKKSVPMKFISSDGFEILVGRNNRQNDELTIKMAYSTDIWLHTKVIPGSHVIIRTNGGNEVTDKTILEAAQLAAFHSKAQNSTKVPVDYTIVKNVHKPNGVKPGMVIYDKYNTIYVDPKLI